MNKALAFMKNLTLTTNQLVILTCAYITLVMNAPFILKTYSAIVALSEYNIFFLLSVPIFLFSLSVMIQCFFAFRWITKPILIILVLLSSLVFYSAVTYGIVFNYGMIQNTFESSHHRRSNAF